MAGWRNLEPRIEDGPRFEWNEKLTRDPRSVEDIIAEQAQAAADHKLRSLRRDQRDTAVLWIAVTISVAIVVIAGIMACRAIL